MQTIRTLDTLREAIGAVRKDGGTVALVPTMGALHEGHLTLVREAKRQATHVVVSIFVNPTQFGPNEDLDAYPRREAQDVALLVAEGVDLLWAPTVAIMYPAGHATTISVSGVSDVLCGAVRPGHFNGVATVVAKLFQQVAPDMAVFGEKDWQQLAVIRRMASDLDFALDIVGVPTVREADGLAMSSRNAYLSASERAIAGQMPEIVRVAAQQVQTASCPDDILQVARDAIVKAGFDSIDYLDMRDGVSLASLNAPQPGARLFVAARIGATRLIDNFPI
jgi:pantoate--beta-alanine ligase